MVGDAGLIELACAPKPETRTGTLYFGYVVPLTTVNALVGRSPRLNKCRQACAARFPASLSGKRCASVCGRVCVDKRIGIF